MATSESDDFESADEELNARKEAMLSSPDCHSSTIGSDSDDDVDYIPVQYTSNNVMRKKILKNKILKKSNISGDSHDKSDKSHMEKANSPSNKEIDDKALKNDENKNQQGCKEVESEFRAGFENNISKPSKESKFGKPFKVANTTEKDIANKRERPQRQKKPREIQSLGAKKLGATRIDKLINFEDTALDKSEKKIELQDVSTPLRQECWEEFDEQNLEEELKRAQQQSETRKEKSEMQGMEDPVNMPEELLSNLTFKDIFKPDGWEGLGNDVELPDDLSDDKYKPILNKIIEGTSEQDTTNNAWGGWGNWDVSSLLNTASSSVSTLTSHVSQGLSLLEGTIGIPDPSDLAKPEIPPEEKPKPEEKESKESKESPTQYLPMSFGFGNFMSSVSSITKLVESTSSKVISGGLDTLETIGKKTMEVLQEGDPGLKKKRAFFSNEADKPILSQVLREAKEKAEVEEKSIEEKELARKVHFESLFDDYQGLVHLEALEMLSKQCNMKIQQQLMNLDGGELTSMQETLDEVKELCDLGDEDDDDEEVKDKDLKQRLDEACKDLGASITYNKLIDIWNEINSEISSEPKNMSHREIFQNAISALAKFTAYSVERFHKTAELLLVKERRSTVNEADSLVQLTNTLSSQIGSIANLYCERLNEFKEETEKSEVISSITTILLEATNASLYVQEAFRLLISILQVGAI